LAEDFLCHFADSEVECVEDIFHPCSCRHRSRWVCYGGSNRVTRWFTILFQNHPQR
jgi:hypothetical protein